MASDFLAGGRATFTVELSREAARGGKPHYSFQVMRGKRLSATFEVRLLLAGAEQPRKYKVLGLYDPKDGAVFKNYRAGFWPSAWTAFERGAAVLNGGALALEKFRDEGWNLHRASTCCHCGKRLSVPASVVTGIGPECENYRRLGISCADETPSWVSGEMARLQYLYWMNADSLLLDQLRDAGREAGLSDEQADALAVLTRKTMRKFQKGKGLNAAWVAFARGEGGQ